MVTSSRSIRPGTWRRAGVACLLLAGGLLAGCGPGRLSTAPAPGPIAREAPAAGAAGEVFAAAGQPAAGAVVYAYRSPHRGLRGPADFGAEVGADGRYFLDLAPGRYWLVARRRGTGPAAGPPRPGDTWAVFPDNPVRIRAGVVTAADFRLQPPGRPARPGGAARAGDTGFRGRAVDPAGGPVAGITALVYRGPDLRRMPDFTSAATGADGRFAVYVPEGGRYCLVLRSGSRGQPSRGEVFGTLAPREDPCRELARGQILELGAVTVAPYRQ